MIKELEFIQGWNSFRVFVCYFVCNLIYENDLYSSMLYMSVILRLI